MAGRLIGAWNPALDSNAAVISGSKLHTYQTGTTTPKATFTDASLTVPLANPVVADSAGRFPEIWSADGGTYDLDWRTAGDVIIKTFAGIQALGATATGAVTRDFGADGRFNIESRGGVTYVEAGDPSPDNTGGTARIGGWGGTQADLLTLDAATVAVTGTLPASSLKGTVTNDAAVAGRVGEYGESVIAVGASTPLTSTTNKTVTSVSLAPGDYDVWGEVHSNVGGSTLTQVWGGGISLTNNALDAQSFSTIWPASVAGANNSIAVAMRRISLAATTPVYLIATSNFTTSTSGAFGSISWRRVR